jgi:hypothetical protein
MWVGESVPIRCKVPGNMRSAASTGPNRFAPHLLSLSFWSQVPGSLGPWIPVSVLVKYLWKTFPASDSFCLRSNSNQSAVTMGSREYSGFRVKNCGRGHGRAHFLFRFGGTVMPAAVCPRQASSPRISANPESSRVCRRKLLNQKAICTSLCGIFAFGAKTARKSLHFRHITRSIHRTSPFYFFAIPGSP